MRSRFYTKSKSAWKAMLAAIRQAEKSIFLEMYIFEDKTDGFDFVQALVDQALHGVHVVVVLDAFGSSNLSINGVEKLRAAGAEVRFFSYWLRRAHRKLLIVDERIGFVGGVNIGSRFVDWNDLQMKIAGRRVVRSMVRSFARVYRATGGSNRYLSEQADRATPLKHARLFFLEHGLTKHTHDLKAEYRTHIDNAQMSIVLVTPYFVPRHWLIEALERALRRHVTLTIILPNPSDHPWIDPLSRYYAKRLQDLGAQVLLARVMNHAKAMLVDKQSAIVGSQNLDPLSFGMNIESGVFFDRPEMVRAVERVVAEWKRSGTSIDKAVVRHAWYDPLVTFVLRMVAPIP